MTYGKFVRRPVDMGNEFRENMTLITDPASDRYLNEYSKLAASLQKSTEGSFETSETEAT
tara:strand:+ start:1653 stop:1832 length:180 start_codon:yes stop_codon:yes gene_type:complete